jgi:hypothetical protein
MGPNTKLGRLLLAAVLALGAAGSASAQTATLQRRENIVTQRATGSFEVKLTPQPVHDGAEGVLGRRSIEKEFNGELAGTSRGEMLAYWSDDAGSGAYVAIERFTGTLGGRTGSFLLVHKGVMERGAGPPLDITVVPDSGDGELKGIVGSMDIVMQDGRHDYVFAYTLAAREPDSR